MPDNKNNVQGILFPPYNNVVLTGVKTLILDHMGGFDSSLRCRVLDEIAAKAGDNHCISSEYIFSDLVKQNYPTLTMQYSNECWKKENFVDSFKNYNVHPELTFQNFICSFNGSTHVGRKFLVSILNKFGYFNPNYCSKNLIFSSEQLDGHIKDYFQNNQEKFYRKFFINDSSERFFQTIYTFDYTKFNHSKNISVLENKLTKSFLHIVSETLATSYYPFITEKFLYSIVTRGLFLAYAQPGWHEHLEKYYGFKRYTRLFDYQFDTIQNPIERLVSLITMVSKFSMMSSDDWRDLYLLEQDSIEYNYYHYFSGNYLTYV